MKLQLDRRTLGYLLILIACVLLIWTIISHLYSQRGYAAPVPEIRYDHDCGLPPRFLIRALSETDDPTALALNVRVRNFAEISQGCTYVDFYFIPHGSKAITTAEWAKRLSHKYFFQTDDGGFALRFLPEGTGHHVPTIRIPNIITRRNVEHWFFWLHFSEAMRGANETKSSLMFEYMPSNRFLIESITLRNGAKGSVFGDLAEVELHHNQGFVIDLADAEGQYRFAVLNVLIGVLASIGTGAITGLAKSIRLARRDEPD